MIYNLHQYFLQCTKNIHTIQEKKAMETRIIKNISNKNERCRDVKIQHANKVRWDPKLNEHKYSSLYFAL